MLNVMLGQREAVEEPGRRRDATIKNKNLTIKCVFASGSFSCDAFFWLFGG